MTVTVHDAPRGFYERPPIDGEGPRLLLVTYHFPPDRAAGALRWQKFAKHGAAFGWSTDVFMQDPAGLASRDPGRLEDLPVGIRVFGVPQPQIWAQRLENWAWHGLRSLIRPRTVEAADAAAQSRSASSFSRDELEFEPLSSRSWIRTFYGWQYYAAHRAWARRVTALARKIYQPGVHRLVVSCGPPHGAHEAARLIARATGLPFVMDLRDPWSLVERWSESVASAWTPRIAHRHERATVREASLVVMNTNPARDAMQDLYPEHAERICAIPNGFDDDEELPPSPRGSCFRIAYAGTVYLDRNPLSLFLAAARVIEEFSPGPEDFAIELMGTVESLDGFTIEQIAEKAGIADFVRVHPPSPRERAAEFLAGANLLVSLPQDSHMAIPSKIFEYMRYEAYLLALATPESATAQLLQGTGADVVGPNDIAALADVLRARYLEFRDGLRPQRISGDERFSRRTQAQRLFAAFDRVVGAQTS